MNKKGANILSHLDKQILGEQLKWVYWIESTLEPNLRKQKQKRKAGRRWYVKDVDIKNRENKKVLPNHNASRINYSMLKCNDTMWVTGRYVTKRMLFSRNKLKRTLLKPYDSTCRVKHIRKIFMFVVVITYWFWITVRSVYSCLSMDILSSNRILVNGTDIFSLSTMSIQNLYNHLYGYQKGSMMTKSELLNMVVARLLYILEKRDETKY